MKTKMKLAMCGMVVVGLVIGTGAVLVADSLFDTTQATPSYVAPVFEINESGETFGSAMGVAFEDLPELTLVEGNNGIIGYARTSEIHGETPSSPEEAGRIQEEIARNGGVRIINVYESDGITIIDTFTIGGNSSYFESDTKPDSMESLYENFLESLYSD